MKTVNSIALTNSQEEQLPGFSPDFPYIATCARLEEYIEPVVPWHWHPAVELFYMESGTLEYATPNGKWVFPAGSGGFVNSNVLHSTAVHPSGEETVQLLHLFVPELLSGGQDSRMDRLYLYPLVNGADIEVIPLSPEDPVQASVLQSIRSIFDLEETAWGYEMTVRNRLADIWLQLLELVRPALEVRSGSRETDEKMKAMLRFIHAHYTQPVPVEDIARAAHVSRRVCFRLFRENLRMSPLEYMTDYRLRKACSLLAETDAPVTAIALDCGLGSSSYFGKVFRQRFGCSPMEFRKKWHDRAI